MGRVVIKNSNVSPDSVSETSIRSLLRNLRISKISDMYHLSFGTTEIEISADLMKDLVENAFLMLDYEDQIELLKTFSYYMR